MAKPDKGKKHTCQSCGTLFYDFKRTPIVCPKCDMEVEVQSLLKPRRPSPQAKAAAPKVEKPKPEDAETPDDLDVEVEEVEEEDDDDLMEDMSDIGDDDADMSEVKEHIAPPGDDKE